MFNILKNFKEKYKNSSSWKEFLASYLINLDDIYKRLEGKTETQQIEILKRALEEQTKKTGELIGEIARQKEAIEELTNENANLKEQIKDNEEIESILSGSGSSEGSINSQRQKEREKIVKEIQTSKTSTAQPRKMLKYLDEIEKLEQKNKKLEENQKKINLNKVKGLLNITGQGLESLKDEIEETETLFEVKPNLLK